MSDLPGCPECNSQYTYEDRNLYVCPECAHEWNDNVQVEDAEDMENVVKDSNGNSLSDGDTVSVIKDLKVKGSSWCLVVQKSSCSFNQATIRVSIYVCWNSKLARKYDATSEFIAEKQGGTVAPVIVLA